MSLLRVSKDKSKSTTRYLKIIYQSKNYEMQKPHSSISILTQKISALICKKSINNFRKAITITINIFFTVSACQTFRYQRRWSFKELLKIKAFATVE